MLKHDFWMKLDSRQSALKNVAKKMNFLSRALTWQPIQVVFDHIIMFWWFYFLRTWHPVDLYDRAHEDVGEGVGGGAHHLRGQGRVQQVQGINHLRTIDVVNLGRGGGFKTLKLGAVFL